MKCCLIENLFLVNLNSKQNEGCPLHFFISTKACLQLLYARRKDKEPDVECQRLKASQCPLLELKIVLFGSYERSFSEFVNNLIIHLYNGLQNWFFIWSFESCWIWKRTNLCCRLKMLDVRNRNEVCLWKIGSNEKMSDIQGVTTVSPHTFASLARIKMATESYNWQYNKSIYLYM